MTTSFSPPSPLSALLPVVFDFEGDETNDPTLPLMSEHASPTTAASSPPPSSGVPTAPTTPPLKSSAGPARRRGKAAKDPSALALKRARRSEIERNSRLRRLDELTRMRQELLRLEYEYKRLSDDEGLEKIVFETDTTQSLQLVTGRSRFDQRRIQRRLAFMTQLLTEEQNQLRKLLQEQELFEETVRAAWRLDFDAGPDMSNLSERDPIEPFKEWVHPARCFAFLRETYELIMTFDSCRTYETTGASFMGWTDKRRIDENTGHLHYGFRKQFLGQHGETLLAKTWDLMVDPVKMARLLVDPSVTTEFMTLQKLNDDVLLIRRDHTHPHVHMTFLTAHVLFRLQTPQGFLLCFRTIPVPEIQQNLKPHEMWFDIHNFSLYNHIYDEHGAIVGCEVVSGGSLNDPTQVTTKHWLFELVISVLRWESICVAPLFLMGATEE